MKATIKDIAKECGVSTATVSMAFSERKTRISEETKKRVLAVAEKYNYHPNNAAVSLVKQKSKMISIVFNDLRNTHISSVFMAISKVLQSKGYSVITHILENDNGACDELIKILACENSSAIIWAKSMENGTAEEMQKLDKAISSMGVPVMTMDGYGFNCGGTDVCFDYEEGAYLAVNHLITSGHKKIGCVAGTQCYHVTEERLAGYRRALEEHGIEFEPHYVYYGDYSMDSGYKAFSYIMGQGVSSIFSMNDEMAFGLYRAARNYGIQIPEDISIIGFDDVPFADVMEIPLSTIRVPVEEMGTFIGERTIECIEKGITERGVKVYKPQLLLRRSTKHI